MNPPNYDNLSKNGPGRLEMDEEASIKQAGIEVTIEVAMNSQIEEI